MARPTKHPLRDAPLLLCVDNSTMYGSVAIVSDSGCINEHTLISSVTHSKRLLAEIDTIMQECELKWDDLDGLAICLGPGSFTGLRIGLTTIKGICMATGLPLMGVSSLEALASQFPYCALPICPILDARKQEVYAALYQTKTGKLLTDLKPVVIGIKQLLTTITKPTLFIGDGVNVYKETITKHLEDHAFFGPPQLIFPRAAAIGTLALNQFKNKQFLDQASASPFYIRASDAEINLQKAQAQTATP